MRYFFDTEFIEDGRTIDLISIGIVSEDGRQYYAEDNSCDLSRASMWVKDNVVAKLTGPRKPREQIAQEIVEFCGERPEFWAYYADYDWVSLCQLYGTMIQLPSRWPMYCRDLKQAFDQIGNLRMPAMDVDKAHHALNDALWVKESFERIAGKIAS